jgi:hypothetical protein
VPSQTIGELKDVSRDRLPWRYLSNRAEHSSQFRAVVRRADPTVFNGSDGAPDSVGMPIEVRRHVESVIGGANQISQKPVPITANYRAQSTAFIYPRTMDHLQRFVSTRRGC